MDPETFVRVRIADNDQHENGVVRKIVEVFQIASIDISICFLLKKRFATLDLHCEHLVVTAPASVATSICPSIPSRVLDDFA